MEIAPYESLTCVESCSLFAQVRNCTNFEEIVFSPSIFCLYRLWETGTSYVRANVITPEMPQTKPKTPSLENLLKLYGFYGTLLIVIDGALLSSSV